MQKQNRKSHEQTRHVGSPDNGFMQKPRMQISYIAIKHKTYEKIVQIMESIRKCMMQTDKGPGPENRET